MQLELPVWSGVEELCGARMGARCSITRDAKEPGEHLRSMGKNWESPGTLAGRGGRTGSWLPVLAQHPAGARVKVRVSSCFHLPVPSLQPSPWQAGPPPPRAHGPQDVWDEPPWEHQHGRGRGGWRAVRGQGLGRAAVQRGEAALSGFTYKPRVAKTGGSPRSRRSRKS